LVGNHEKVVEEAPFQTKSMCGKVSGINRQTVAAYLDTDKLYKKNLFLILPL
jgi:hypothetical protein